MWNLLKLFALSFIVALVMGMLLPSRVPILSRTLEIFVAAWLIGKVLDYIGGVYKIPADRYE